MLVARSSSCTDGWAKNSGTVNLTPAPEPEQHQTNEGPLVTHESLHGDQQDPIGPELPPLPSNADAPWVAQLPASFPSFNATDAATVNQAISDAQNSVGPGSIYGTILTGQFRRSGDATSPTPQKALGDVRLGSVEIVRDNDGKATDGKIHGNVFDGRTSSYPAEGTTVQQYFIDNPTVNAIHVGGIHIARPRILWAGPTWEGQDLRTRRSCT